MYVPERGQRAGWGRCQWRWSFVQGQAPPGGQRLGPHGCLSQACLSHPEASRGSSPEWNQKLLIHWFIYSFVCLAVSLFIYLLIYYCVFITVYFLTTLCMGKFYKVSVPFTTHFSGSCRHFLLLQYSTFLYVFYPHRVWLQPDQKLCHMLPLRNSPQQMTLPKLTKFPQHKIFNQF